MADKGAWHGDPELKAAAIQRMKEHREDDSIVQGIYQMRDPSKALGYKGCALGCMVREQAKPHDVTFALLIEETYGIPDNVAPAIDDAFETLDFKDCAEFAVAVVEAIPVGADLKGAGRAYWDRLEEWDNDATGKAPANALLKLVSEAAQVTA